MGSGTDWTGGVEGDAGIAGCLADTARYGGGCESMDGPVPFATFLRTITTGGVVFTTFFGGMCLSFRNFLTARSAPLVSPPHSRTPLTLRLDTERLGSRLPVKAKAGVIRKA